MSKKYYYEMWVVYDNDPRECLEFGDFDRSVVTDEIESIKETGREITGIIKMRIVKRKAVTGDFI